MGESITSSADVGLDVHQDILLARLARAGELSPALLAWARDAHDVE